jgi:hypothetical protein
MPAQTAKPTDDLNVSYLNDKVGLDWNVCLEEKGLRKRGE